MRLLAWRGMSSLIAQGLLAMALAIGLPLLATIDAMAQDVPAANATVRVIQATPGAPGLDVLLDGQPLLEHLEPGQITDYLAVPPGEHRLQAVPSGQPVAAALVDLTLEAAPGRAYLLAVFGLLNDVQGALYDVDLSEIEPGNSRVRLLNFSPDAGAIDLLEAGGKEWFADVALGEAAAYRDIPPGAYGADLRGADDLLLRTVDELVFEETRGYDIVVLGLVADDSLQVQALETIVSPPCAEVLGVPGEGSNACVRVVNAAPDAAAIDVWLNDAQVAHALAFGAATDYAAFPSGVGRGLQVLASGRPDEAPLLEASLDFEPGQAYELLLTGAENELALLITGTDLRPVAAGQARVRVIDVSPAAGALDVGRSGDDAPLFAGLEFGEPAGYLILDAGDYPLSVHPAGDPMTVLLQPEVTLEEGMVYDLILLGQTADQSLALLTLTAPVSIQIGKIATPVVVATSTPTAEASAAAAFESAPAAIPAR